MTDVVVWLKGTGRNVSVLTNTITGITFVMNQVFKFYLHPTLHHLVTLSEFSVFGEFEVCEYNLTMSTFNRVLVMCGLYSNFTVYPGSPEIQYSLSYFFAQNFACTVKLDLISSDVVETNYIGQVETFFFLDMFSIILKERSYVYKLNIEKYCQVLIHGSQAPDTRLTVFDGPGILSDQQVQHGKYFSFMCKTYTCILHVVICLTNLDLLQISYTNKTVGYSHTALNTTTKYIWETKHLGHNGINLVAIIISASNSSQVCAFVKSFTFSSQSDFNCLYGGFEYYDVLLEGLAYSETSCSPMRNYRLKPVYSKDSQLMIIAYAHTNYAELFATVEILETLCTIKKLNLCSFAQKSLWASWENLQGNLFTRHHPYFIMFNAAFPQLMIVLKDKPCLKALFFVDGKNQCHKVPFIDHFNLRVFQMLTSFIGNRSELTFQYSSMGVLSGQEVYTTTKHPLSGGSKIVMDGRNVEFNFSIARWKAGTQEQIHTQSLEFLHHDTLVLKPPMGSEWFFDVTCSAGLSKESLFFKLLRFRKRNWIDISVIPESKWQDLYPHQISEIPSSPISIHEDSPLQLITLDSLAIKNVNISVKIETLVSFLNFIQW